MSATRRSVLGLGLASAAMTIAPTSASAARPKRYAERHRVDVHAHYIAPDYRTALVGAGITAIGGLPTPDWSPESAMAFMDAHGIAVQLLSVSDPGVDFLPADQAAQLATACNDYVAGVVRTNPTRFGAFAVVSLQDTAAAQAEIARCYDQLGLDGVGLLSSHGGRYLGEPAFAPLLADLDARRAWVMVHPTAVADDDKPSYQFPAFGAEYPFDTTRTFISLLINGAFNQYPNIRWQFAHGGGTAPMLRARLSALAKNAKLAQPVLGLPAAAASLTEKSPADAFRRSYFDTALIGDPPALEAVAGVAGAKHVVFGSDWPFAALLYDAKGDPQPALNGVFTPAQRHAVDRLTARGQFKRLRFLPASD